MRPTAAEFPVTDARARSLLLRNPRFAGQIFAGFSMLILLRRRMAAAYSIFGHVHDREEAPPGRGPLGAGVLRPRSPSTARRWSICRPDTPVQGWQSGHCLTPSGADRPPSTNNEGRLEPAPTAFGRTRSAEAFRPDRSGVVAERDQDVGDRLDERGRPAHVG